MHRVELLKERPAFGSRGAALPGTALQSRPPDTGRVRVHGKFFRLDQRKWYLKGLTYGPFAQNSAGYFLPERPQMLRDFAHIARLGASALRLYHAPPSQLLDDALQHGLRVLIDVPWEKHRCFFEDWSSQRDAVESVRRTARELGGHPGVFAISVANEIPKDVVRFYGALRIERFLDDLQLLVKEEAPDCLVTYTNYPSTEFVRPSCLDFYCANVYLNAPEVLGQYLDRLQHVSGPLPLVLGEYGIDSIRRGRQGQAEVLGQHVREVFRHGLAGSFVFAYTDDWFTGGYQVEDWAFGITDRDRAEKPAADELRRVWSQAPAFRSTRVPKVSVIVCSYNGARTLEECLQSLVRLDYPDYEILLVDDGSTDNTPDIAARFPEVKYIRQENLGLSVARNVGARAAQGEIVAYTDSDCIADESWLTYLVGAMHDQQVDAIGGPNVTPPSDNWLAKCVAASPGNPSHVMLDDRYAEHVPGCNMAFNRAKLLGIGGFDPRFRQAGDDVDICWRFIDDGMKIGCAPAALIWHHRRDTIRAYWQQQKGYGRSEAILQFKHPQRFSAFGASMWNGVIYGEGAVGLPVVRPRVYHGRFGTGLFQIIYNRNEYSAWSYFTLLEWHILASFFMLLSPGIDWIGWIAVAMWSLTCAAAWRSARNAPLEKGSPFWCRAVVFGLYLVQPVVRSSSRYMYRVINKRLPQVPRVDDDCLNKHVKRITFYDRDLYWESDEGLGREHLLEAVVDEAQRLRWAGNFHHEWKPFDVELIGDRWHNLQIRSADEELGGLKRFVRARLTIHLTRLARVLAISSSLLTIVAVLTEPHWIKLLIPCGSTSVLIAILVSRRRCWRAAASLLWRSGLKAGLRPVPAQASSSSSHGTMEAFGSAADVRSKVWELEGSCAES